MMLPWMAHSALFDRGNGMIYDDVRNITWLKNANYASVDLNDTRVTDIISTVGTVDGHQLLPPPDTFDPTTGATIPSDFSRDAPNTYPGMMTWWGAKAWAQTLNFKGITGWRLPKLITKAGGTLSSELTELVNTENMGLFENYLQLPPSATPNQIDSWWLNDAPDPSNLSAALLDSNGFPKAAFNISQRDSNPALNSKDIRIFAWAVHDGDVAAVPLPGAVWLLGSALLGLAGAIRRRG